MGAVWKRNEMDKAHSSNAIYAKYTAPVAEIIINAPERRNALNLAMWAALPSLVAEAEQAEEIRAIILHGGDSGHFAAGADISEFADVYADEAASATSADTIAQALEALVDCQKPIIAAIEGACVGGGVSLALACDIRIASEDARFGVTPARLGLVYPAKDTCRLVETVGAALAKDILFTGRIFDAARALRIGLIEDICDPGTALKVARERAATIADVSQYSVREMKKMISAFDSPAGLSPAEGRQIFLDAAAGDDFKEGYRAFLEKRKPDFPSS